MTWAELWKDTQEVIFVAAVVGPGLVGVFLLFLHSKFMSRSGCTVCRTAITTRVDELESHVDALNSHRNMVDYKLGGLPTSNDVAEIRIAMVKLSGTTDTLRSEIESLNKILTIVKNQGDTMHNHLLEEAAKRARPNT